MKCKGILKLRDNTMLYYIYNSKEVTNYDLNKELFDMLDLGKTVRVQIKTNGKKVFDEIGVVNFKNNSKSIEDWFVGNVCLGDVLFDLTDQEIELNIDFDSKEIEKVQKIAMKEVH